MSHLASRFGQNGDLAAVLRIVRMSRFCHSADRSVAHVLSHARRRPARQEEITIYRDEFGTPHIFAATAEGACFGHGYAQAADRLEELLKQYVRATGTMSEAFGPEFLHDDYRQRVWQHAAIAKAKYGELSRQVARADRGLSGRRQAVHERASLGSARLGARDRALDVRGAVALHHLGLARGRGRPTT